MPSDNTVAALARSDIFDLLSRLVDKNIVVYDEDAPGAGRYRLLETVRQYGGERLLASGETATLRDRHRDWFAAWLPELFLSVAPWERMEADYPNVRAALEWCLVSAEAVDIATLRRLGRGLTTFWMQRGRINEGREMLDMALARLVATASPGLVVELLLTAAALAQRHGDYAAARAHAEDALRRMETSGESDVVEVLSLLSITALLEGNYADVRSYGGEALRIWQGRGDRSGMVSQLANLGHAARLDGDLADARAYYEAEAALLEAALAEQETPHASDRIEQGHVWLNLGHLSRLEGNLAAARTLYRKALLRIVEMGARTDIAYGLEAFACLEAAAGEPSRAARSARLFGAADALREAQQMLLPPADRASYAPSLQSARAALGEDAFAAAWVEGRPMAPEQAVAYALDEEPTL